MTNPKLHVIIHVEKDRKTRHMNDISAPKPQLNVLINGDITVMNMSNLPHWPQDRALAVLLPHNVQHV